MKLVIDGGFLPKVRLQFETKRFMKSYRCRVVCEEGGLDLVKLQLLEGVVQEQACGLCSKALAAVGGFTHENTPLCISMPLIDLLDIHDAHESASRLLFDYEIGGFCILGDFFIPNLLHLRGYGFSPDHTFIHLGGIPPSSDKFDVVCLDREEAHTFSRLYGRTGQWLIRVLTM